MATTSDDLRTREAATAADEVPDAGAAGPGAPGADPATTGGPGGPAGPGVDGDDAVTEESPYRIATAVALPVIAAAVMVGGIFVGALPRVVTMVAGLLGLGLALLAARIRRPVGANLVIVAGLAAIGPLVSLFRGPGAIAGLRDSVVAAAASGDVLRPPVPFDGGWAAIVGWLMAIVGFGAAWVAIVVKRPTLGLVVPLPLAAIAGISVPAVQQIPSGIAVLVLFALSLGLLASTTAVGEGDEKPPLAYELRKAARSVAVLVPLVLVLTLLAYNFGDFLFPKPVFDPTQEPQKPKTTPLTEVEDRVLFTVDAEVNGPWRIGSLDMYDGEDWRLPPFAENQLADVPEDGFVDRELEPGIRAEFTIAGLEGAVLPGLPNPVGIVATGPRLAYDARNGNIRVAQGQIQAGLKYTVAAAALPAISDLQAITESFPPEEAEEFAEIPVEPGPAAAALIRESPTTSKWDQFDFLRTHILDNVVATGAGVPKSVTPEDVEDMLAGSGEGTPYEIVAAQAMFARWIGVPSRIGYGFDGGELVNGVLEVRPKNGATFVEVYFPGYKWLPVIGVPKQAKPTVGEDAGPQQFDPSILPSDEVAVQLYLPVLVPPGSVFYEQLRNIVLVVVPLVLLVIAAYTLWPALRKAVVRRRRRAAALAAGPRARIALAYAEWRDWATDFGFAHATDTPLMFLDRFFPDEEHDELAWLTTRALWGDLQHDVTPELAASAEELSRALRRRLAAAQPATVRIVAALSRLSLRNPYAPETDLTERARRTRRKEEDRELVNA